MDDVPQPVVHQVLSQDEHWSQVGEPPAEPFAAAGFQARRLEWDNRPIRRSRFPFPWPDARNDRLVAFRQRYDFPQAVAGIDDEFAQLLALRRWAHEVFTHRSQIGLPAPVRWTGDPFEIMEVAAAGGFLQCTQYAVLLQSSLAALGWVSRHVGIGSSYSDREGPWHHGVVDVFVNDLGKWVALDANFDVHYETAGVPLSPWEVGEAFGRDGGAEVDIVVGPERGKVDSAGLRTVGGAHESSRYLWALHYWHCDPFTRTGSWETRLKLVLVGERHAGEVWHQGGPEERAPHIGYADGSFQLTRRAADVYPDMGTCRLDLDRSDAHPAVAVAVGTFTPNFDTVLASVDGRPFRPVGLKFDWYVHEGENVLCVRTRNRLGRMGKVSRIEAVLEKAGREGEQTHDGH